MGVTCPYVSLLTQTQLAAVTRGWVCVGDEGVGCWAEQEYGGGGGQGMVKVLDKAMLREGQKGLPSRS